MAKPKLALIPASQGPLVYSVLPSDGSGDFSFSRGSSATRINSQGLIETVASGDSRLEYPLIDGVVNGCPSFLLEPERTNLITYSEDFTQWFNTRSSDSSGFISPTGGTNATKFIADTTASSSHIIKSTDITISSGQTYTYSVFVKANQLNYVRLMFTDSAVSKYLSAYFNLSNGTVGTTSDGSAATLDSANIESFGNGWYKCSVSGDLDTTTVANARIYLADGDNSSSFNGDGTSGIYIYGAQVEQGSYPTSYIPTNGTAVTRLADTATGAGDASTFNDSEGVLMFEALFDKEDSVSRYISISDSSSSDRVLIGVTGGTNILRAFVFSGGVQQAQIIEAIDLSQTIKVSISYKQNEIKFYKNGFLVGEDTSGITPVGLSELAFNAYPASALFYGKTKQIQYYNSALTDSELEELTSWESFTAMAYGQLYTIE